jgi:zinc transporter 1/2/3
VDGIHDYEPSLTEVPFALLRGELERRQNGITKPSCGSGSARGTYNTPLHVFALFLILVLSTIGQSPVPARRPEANDLAACSFPIIARRFPRFPIPHHFLFLSRHFGTGVLIATAFVHLLPTAFVSLTDPCLPNFWNKGYPAMAGLIAMISVLVVVSIEMFFATHGAGHTHGSEYGTLPQDAQDEDDHHSHSHRHSSNRRRESLRPFRQGKLGNEDASGGIPLYSVDSSSGDLMSGEAAPTHHPNGITKPANGSYDDVEDPLDFDLEELESSTPSPTLLPTHHRNQSTSSLIADHQHHNHRRHPDPAENPQKMLLQCLLLEAGILFHSVFIGMALSVATGTPFIVLLIAISFHQTFEGLALGSRIAAIPSFSQNSPKPWLMALAYGTTTPVGQAIGLVVHNLYDPASQGGLLMVGVMNAISSGLLLFAGLVELLAEDFLSDRSYEVLKGRRRLEACVAVAGGGALMAIVGAWA